MVIKTKKHHSAKPAFKQSVVKIYHSVNPDTVHRAAVFLGLRQYDSKSLSFYRLWVMYFFLSFGKSGLPHGLSISVLVDFTIFVSFHFCSFLLRFIWCKYHV